MKTIKSALWDPRKGDCVRLIEVKAQAARTKSDVHYKHRNPEHAKPSHQQAQPQVVLVDEASRLYLL